MIGPDGFTLRFHHDGDLDDLIGVGVESSGMDREKGQAAPAEFEAGDGAVGLHVVVSIEGAGGAGPGATSVGKSSTFVVERRPDGAITS
jgi:hypothetical protein